MDILSISDNHNSTPATIKSAENKSEPFWGIDGFTFSDVLDVINPLQHLPVISNYYREQTDDDACEGSRLIGGALFGGLFGGVAGVLSSFANSAVRQETHNDVSEHILAMAEEPLSAVKNNSVAKAAHSSANTIAEAFLDNVTNGPFYIATKSSVQNNSDRPLQLADTLKSELLQKGSSADLSISETMNPFFADILHEYANVQSTSFSSEQINTQRSRDWGKV